MVDTLILLSRAPTNSIVDIELAEFLLAYSAYTTGTQCIFIDAGLAFLHNTPARIPKLPSPSQMLTALSYGNLSCYGLWTSPDTSCPFEMSLPLTWITPETLAQMKNAARHHLLYQ